MKPCRFIAVAVLSLSALTGCQMILAEAAVDHYVAGKLAAESENYQLALAELARAVRFDPGLSLAHTAIGDIHRKQGNCAMAAVAYENACQVNAYAFRPHYNLGVTYQMLAQQAKGDDAMTAYIAKAIHTYLRAVTIRPKDFDANLNLSACYFQQGKFELAVQYCAASTAIDPKNPFAFSNLAIIHEAQGKPYDAIGAYRKSLELDEHQPKIWLNLGTTYARIGRMPQALNAFGFAAREDPRWPVPWVQMGSCHFHMKQWDQALAAYTKALELDGDCAEAHRGLGVIYMSRYVVDRTLTDMRDKALDSWTRSLELDSSQQDLVNLVRKYTPTYAVPEL
ncbi:MAG TPA: tetratricopeptide repeat protein [Phycisphaerae bacterium]|nr:tetratricopeptide repeat protein [Phycisphaerae bacterium]